MEKIILFVGISLFLILGCQKEEITKINSATKIIQRAPGHKKVKQKKIIRNFRDFVGIQDFGTQSWDYKKIKEVAKYDSLKEIYISVLPLEESIYFFLKLYRLALQENKDSVLIFYYYESYWVHDNHRVMGFWLTYNILLDTCLRRNIYLGELYRKVKANKDVIKNQDYLYELSLIDKYFGEIDTVYRYKPERYIPPGVEYEISFSYNCTKDYSRHLQKLFNELDTLRLDRNPIDIYAYSQKYSYLLIKKGYSPIKLYNQVLKRDTMAIKVSFMYCLNLIEVYTQYYDGASIYLGKCSRNMMEEMMWESYRLFKPDFIMEQSDTILKQIYNSDICKNNGKLKVKADYLMKIKGFK